MSRFYVLRIETTLFGDVGPVREWGVMEPEVGRDWSFIEMQQKLRSRLMPG